MVPINLIAVFAAAIVTMVIGGVWYGPLFSKPWMRLNGFIPTPESIEAGKKGMPKMYAIMFVGALITAYVLAGVHVFASAYLNLDPASIGSGLLAGFMSWLGFTAPIAVNYTLTTNRSWKLWFINAGYYLVSFLVMGSIIALWP